MNAAMPKTARPNHLLDRASPVIANLDSLALIEVTGEDAHSFLQGQFCNDVDALGAESGAGGGCQLNAYCNPKGRVLAVIRLIRRAGGFGLIVPAELADGLLSRLKMFVLRAKVGIARQPEIALLGLINGAEADVGDGEGSGIQRVSVDGIAPRRLIIGGKPAMESFLRARPDGMDRQPDDALWRLMDILSGIPQIYPPTVEAFIPQMINLDLVDGLSFTKGCYPGQEIVARLRYLGKVKQRMRAGVVQGIETLAPGDPLYSPRRAEQKAGQVIDAVQTGDGEYTLSATAPADGTEPEPETGALRVGSASGPALTGIPLPYAASPEQPPPR